VENGDDGFVSVCDQCATELREGEEHQIDCGEWAGTVLCEGCADQSAMECDEEDDL
jgi:hypothetical protein